MGSLETIIETKNLCLKYQQILLLSTKQTKKFIFHHLTIQYRNNLSSAMYMKKVYLQKNKFKQTHLDGTVACSLSYLTVFGLKSVKLSINNVLLKKYITS